MKFNYQFSNLLGTVYRSGNLIFTPDGNSVISPVGNKISGNMRHVSFKILRYLICHTSENMASISLFCGVLNIPKTHRNRAADLQQSVS